MPGAPKAAPVLAVDPDTRVFHRKHLIQALWGLVIAVPLFIAGIVWERVRGPDSVIVLNPDTTTRFVIAADSAQRRVLAGVLDEIRALRLTTAVRSGGVTFQRAASEPETTLRFASAVTTEFPFPPVVEGYLSRDFGSFGGVRCAPIDHRAGADAIVEVTIRTAADTSRLSPLFVRISRAGRNGNATQLFEQRFRLEARTIVAVPVPTTSGTYELDVGVYALGQLATKYPPFYHRSCQLRVQE